MSKEFIINRKNQKICVLVEQSKVAKGLVFIMHGLGAWKEQHQILAINDAFRSYDFTTVRFDNTNSIGESGGKFEDATITNYYHDLEDVVSWSQSQKWYQEPFVLAGQSLGGFSAGYFAEKYPAIVKAIVPISPLVSGTLSLEAHQKYEPNDYQEWQRTGIRIRESVSKPGLIKKLPWSHVEDRMQYDLIPQASKFTMPFLTIVGEHDTSTPPDHVKVLYEAVSGPKEMHVIQGAPHTFRDPKHLDEIKTIIGKWIEKYLIK